MPYGYMAPPGASYFHEGDIIKVAIWKGCCELNLSVIKNTPIVRKDSKRE